MDTGEQDWGVVAFNQEFYEHIADAFKETLVADKSVVINQEWAFELLHKQD
ncbi:MAG: hypothetical protein MJ092_07560 [Lachnospiraceae bacterium]|nr:hypothetical protein [Lachnospiraceae bacterium]